MASCRARIKSRIRFRGEGESDVGSLGPGFMAVYSSLLFCVEKHGHNLRYEKIDVVDSPTIRAAFVTALVVASHRRNMEILFSSPRNSHTKGFRKAARLSYVSGKNHK